MYQRATQTSRFLGSLGTIPGHPAWLITNHWNAMISIKGTVLNLTIHLLIIFGVIGLWLCHRASQRAPRGTTEPLTLATTVGRSLHYICRRYCIFKIFWGLWILSVPESTTEPHGAPQSLIMHNSTPQCTTEHHIVPQSTTEPHSVMQSNTMHHIVPQTSEYLGSLDTTLYHPALSSPNYWNS